MGNKIECSEILMSYDDLIMLKSGIKDNSREFVG